MTNDPLRDELRRLARSLEGQGIKLIVGGGYGLLLRAEYVRRSGVRTRFAELPGARSTNDIDIFLGAEIIVDGAKTTLIREALDELGYVPVESAKFYQFVRPIEYAGLPRGVKIDFLAAPVEGEGAAKVKSDARRIRPRAAKGLHAHTTPEALTVEDHLLAFDVNADTDEPSLMVYLPHPFSYLLLKLFAFHDQIESEEKRHGAYHAFDIYRTIGMMTEAEWGEAHEMRDRYAATEPVSRARGIVRELFSGIEARGVLRLRDHARTVGEVLPLEQLRELIGDVRELLPPP